MRVALVGPAALYTGDPTHDGPDHRPPICGNTGAPTRGGGAASAHASGGTRCRACRMDLVSKPGPGANHLEMFPRLHSKWARAEFRQGGRGRELHPELYRLPGVPRAKLTALAIEKTHGEGAKTYATCVPLQEIISSTNLPSLSKNMRRTTPRLESSHCASNSRTPPHHLAEAVTCPMSSK